MNKKATFLLGAASFSGLKFTLKALGLAEVLHADQFRDDGTSYVDHVVGVAHLLVAHGIRDDNTLAASILHDVIEDTSFTHENICREFNEDIAGMARRLTKTADVLIVTYYAGIEEDIRTVVIKAADRTHNVSDMVKAFSVERMEKYIKETEEYVLPMMKRARKKYQEYGNVLVSLSEHIKAVLLLAQEVVRLKKAESEK